MATTDELQRQVNEVLRELADLRNEATANVGLLATAIRQTRLGLATLQQAEALKRTTSPIPLIGWDPRQGEFGKTPLDATLLDRLREGSSIDVPAQPGAYPGAHTNLVDAFDQLRSLSTTGNPGTVALPDVTYETLALLESIYGDDDPPLVSWEGTRASGAATATMQPAYQRIGESSFNTTGLSLALLFGGAGTTELRARSRSIPGAGMPGGRLPWGYLVPTCVLVVTQAWTTGGAAQLILELENVTDATIAATVTTDLKSLTVGTPMFVSATSGVLDAAGRAKTFRWRVRLTATATGAAQAGTVVVFEPALVSSPIVDAPTYTPAVGAFLASTVAHLAGTSSSRVLRSRRAVDTDDRLLVTGDGDHRWGDGTAAGDIRVRRAGTKTLELDDGAAGPGALWVAGDVVQELGSALALSYNGDGTLASVTRSGAQGPATTTVTYAGGQVTQVQTVRGGKTVTVVPTYAGGRITDLARTVA